MLGELKEMLTKLRPFFARIPKAKTGKLGAPQHHTLLPRLPLFHSYDCFFVAPLVTTRPVLGRNFLLDLLCAVLVLLSQVLVRVIIDEASRIPNSAPVVVEMCQSIIAWAEAEERTFLRLNLQAKLASALFDVKKVIFSFILFIKTINKTLWTPFSILTF